MTIKGACPYMRKQYAVCSKFALCFLLSASFFLLSASCSCLLLPASCSLPPAYCTLL